MWFNQECVFVYGFRVLLMLLYGKRVSVYVFLILYIVVLYCTKINKEYKKWVYECCVASLPLTLALLYNIHDDNAVKQCPRKRISVFIIVVLAVNYDYHKNNYISLRRSKRMINLVLIQIKYIKNVESIIKWGRSHSFQTFETLLLRMRNSKEKFKSDVTQ